MEVNHKYYQPPQQENSQFELKREQPGKNERKSWDFLDFTGQKR